MNDQTNQKIHSVKVPRIYKQSAGILAAFIRGEGSVKDLVYNQTGKNRHPRIKAVYALVSEAARNENILSRLFSVTGLIEKEHPLDPCLAKILASELLWGKGLLKAGDSKPVLTSSLLPTSWRCHRRMCSVYPAVVLIRSSIQRISLEFLKPFSRSIIESLPQLTNT